MTRDTLIKGSDGQDILASEVDHINVTEQQDGKKAVFLVSKRGAKVRIEEDEIPYFIEHFNFALQAFGPKN